jgi:hypothetical protein
VKSDGNVDKLAKEGYQRTVHSYKNARAYIVTVERTNARGERAVGHLKGVIGSQL